MKSLKKFFFYLGFSSLLIPLVLGFTPINKFFHLSNDISVEEPKMNWKTFLADTILSNKTGEYRKTELKDRDKVLKKYTDDINAYYKKNFGLRPFYIKVRNQIDYSFFNEAHAKSVLIGKDGYLFEEQYIESYYGRDFIGEDSIRNRVAKLKFVQDELEKRGKLVLVVVAPGKGAFYPEFIPDNLKSERGPTNYDTYAKAFKDYGINCIDFNKDFADRKGISKHVLYPKNGIHWSQHAMYHSLDSMVKYIEKKQKIDLPDYDLVDRAPGDTVMFGDDDIGTGLNIFSELDDLKMSYPKFNFIWPENKDRPKVLSVSDSFYWQMYNLGITENLFGGGQFWFYNSVVYPDSEQGNGYVFSEYKNLYEELLSTDVIILMASEANMYKFSFGFIEQSHDALQEGLASYETRIAEIIETIKGNSTWFSKVVNKANERGISVDEMLALDAQYVYDYEKQKE